ncbi:hypothetical protein DFA_08576 [Cavenderia fasciculata]|uniref:Uncharacterized protein n=1 Tax=Cavenderia fasciculata TaxID=261658 RepID=F4Q316_CACFS|nr:uncharacterized protein DFA_08576 [Cavenderia fasciculata]EGG17580.1 hypothetical protein DFA_08576 [Cavenderia fasciculata]|eukprot:XP_004356064.1 hypothetical protein DFA_08576 [Cavenderia fasciculata]
MMMNETTTNSNGSGSGTTTTTAAPQPIQSIVGKEDTKLEELLKICSRVQVFNVQGEPLFRHPPVGTFSKDEFNECLSLFDNSSKAISQGITIEGSTFELYRAFNDLVVGRRGDETTGEGISFMKEIFMLATYQLPILSARVMPLMKDYLSTYQ